MRYVEQLTPRVLVQSLRSRVCPACGGAKVPGQTLCMGDYRALHPQQRSALYRRLGDGYAMAVLYALDSLEIEQLHLPEQRQQ